MKRILVSTLAVAVMLTAGNILAADFSPYSTKDLSNMRGTMQNATAEEREAFRTEWQQRTQNMTQEERQQYAGKSEKAGQGKGQMTRQRSRIHQDNTNQQGSYGMGSGQGMGRGGSR